MTSVYIWKLYFRPTPLQHYLFPAGGDGIHLVSLKKRLSIGFKCQFIKVVDERGNFKEDNFNRAMATLQTVGEASKGDSKGRKGGLKATGASGETNIYR